MESIDRVGPIALEFRVNGLEFRQGFLHWSDQHLGSVEVLIEHRLLGPFRLHDEFIVELREGSSPEWRQVTLKELTVALLLADDNPPIKEAGECDDHTSWNAQGSERWPSRQRPPFPRITVEGDDSHLERARKTLLLARKSFRIVGGVDPRGRCTGHLTLAVESAPEARELLCQRGFLESPTSQYECIDSRTGWKIRLLEDSRLS